MEQQGQECGRERGAGRLPSHEGLRVLARLIALKMLSPGLVEEEADEAASTWLKSQDSSAASRQPKRPEGFQ